MEGLGVASSVIAVVSLAGQVVQGCVYLRDVFENAITAPKQIRILGNELLIIERIVRATPNIEQHKEELDFCQERILKLCSVIEKYGELDGIDARRKWSKRLAMALNEKKINKHLASLREAKGYLQHIQNMSSHDGTLVKADKIIENIQQLSTSNSEASQIVSRIEGKVENIARITEQIQLALPELANRFVLRENSARMLDESASRQLADSLSSLLRDQLSDHLSQLILARRETKPDRPDTKTIALEQEQPCCVTAQETSNIPPAMQKWENHEKCPVHQRILELSNTTPSDLEDGVMYNRPRAESTSSHKTTLGEVVMRTVSAVYYSLEEISTEPFPFPLKAKLMQPAHFPVTITTTEILLLPRSWNQARGASLHCQHLSTPEHHLADINLQIINFADRTAVSTPFAQRPEVEYDGTAVKLRTPKPSEEPWTSMPLSALLYTAFKTAFVARKSSHCSSSQSLHKTPLNSICRNSFDNDINDALELVHLWIESDLDSEILRIAFPQERRVADNHLKVTRRSDSLRMRLIEPLRLGYISELVTELVSGTNSAKLDLIHQHYWEAFARIVSVASIATIEINCGFIFHLKYIGLSPPADVELAMNFWMVESRTSWIKRLAPDYYFLFILERSLTDKETERGLDEEDIRSFNEWYTAVIRTVLSGFILSLHFTHTQLILESLRRLLPVEPTDEAVALYADYVFKAANRCEKMMKHLGILVSKEK